MADPRYRPKNSGRSKSIYQEDDEFEEQEAKYDYEVDEDDEDEDEDEAEAEENRYSYRRRVIEEEANDEEEDDDDDDDELERHPKKRKLKNLMDYELAPRSKNSQAGGSGGGGGGGGGARNSSPNEWTERETFALLEAWGNRYLELGRKSLRSEDWNEVAEKVSEVSKAERLDTQCRNRLDTLKKKYKKEKAMLKEMGAAGGGGSRWTYFKKMDMLMAVSTKQQCGLACGVDSGEYVFMNPKVYLNCANGFDEMRDSPGNSESCEGNDYDDGGGGDEGSSSFSLLADSIQKFGSIYEKIENSKRQQMMELEKMRLDFHKELELQKKQILERAQAEIEKIQDGDDIDDDDDDDDSDASAENLSG